MAEPYLTMAEIEAQYPNEWVLIDRPKVNVNGDVIGGHVVMHTADRVEFDRQLPGFRLSDSAVLHVYDPLSEPIYVITPWFDDLTPDEDSSTSPEP